MLDIKGLFHSSFITINHKLDKVREIFRFLLCLGCKLQGRVRGGLFTIGLVPVRQETARKPVKYEGI